MSEAARRPVWRELLTIAAFCAFFFFFRLGDFGLVGADEPRYAQIAREMLERSDPVTPMLHGEPWLEKPVLYYWGAMLSYALFGVGDGAARLPSAVLATLMVLVIYGVLRRYRPGAHLDAALIVTGTAGIIGFAHGASTDMPLTATFTAAMICWWAWLRGGQRRWLAAFYFFTALAVLAKGPVAAGFAPIIIGLLAWAGRDWSMLRRTLWWPGVALFFAVALPWYIAVQMAMPDFFRIFILEHNLLRFGTRLYRHVQPFWYFVPVFLLLMLPWTVYAVRAVWEAARTVWRRRARDDGEDALFPAFLAIWTLFPILFFSISQSKLPGYILPSVPPAAMLVADLLHRRAERGERPRALALALHAVVSGVLLGAVQLLPAILLRQRPAGRLVLPIAIALLVAGGVFLTVRRCGYGALRFVSLAVMIVALGVGLPAGTRVADSAVSARGLARDLHAMDQGRSTVAVLRASRDIEYGLGWFRDARVYRYERGEVPPGDHLLLVRRGWAHEVPGMVAARRARKIGDYEPLQVEYWWVSRPLAAGGP